MKKPLQAPPPPSSSTAGTQPGRFTLPSLRASGGSGSTVYGSKTQRASFFFPSLPRSVQDSTTDSVIFPVTLTSSVVVAAKKPTLSKISTVHKLSVDSNQQPSSHTHAYLNFPQHKPTRAKEESYLWFVLPQWPCPGLCPLNRAGERRTCRPSPSSWRDACVLWLKVRKTRWKPGIGFTLRSLASETSEIHNVSKSGPCRGKESTQGKVIAWSERWLSEEKISARF